MCGRYTVADVAGQLEMRETMDLLYLQAGYTPSASGEVFPTNFAPVLKEVRTPSLLRWGFPKWGGSGVVINARSETALDKPMFRKPLLERRCIIPSTGFFEWKQAEGQKRKDKYLLQLPDDGLLFMAGMYGLFKDAVGQEYEAYVILTTAANDSVAPIHDRMPVILLRDELEPWLHDAAFLGEVLGRSGPRLVTERAS